MQQLQILQLCSRFGQLAASSSFLNRTPFIHSHLARPLRCWQKSTDRENGTLDQHRSTCVLSQRLLHDSLGNDVKQFLVLSSGRVNYRIRYLWIVYVQVLSLQNQILFPTRTAGMCSRSQMRIFRPDTLRHYLRTKDILKADLRTHSAHSIRCGTCDLCNTACLKIMNERTSVTWFEQSHK